MTNTASRTCPFGFTRGAQHIFGGSVATVVATGHTYEHGRQVPVVLVSCPDFGPEFIRLVGNATYKLGPAPL